MKALISVSDKTGVAAFATGLRALGWEIICSGGTYRTLTEAGIAATPIEELTGLAECFDGRLKTLHHKIYGGILARRDRDMDTLGEMGIQAIDLVAVNLYPFRQQADPAAPEQAIELIDIGGPALLRAAAKNHAGVIPVVDPADYNNVLDELRDSGSVSAAARRALARKVFAHTAAYDSAIAAYFNDDLLPDSLTLSYEKLMGLRYGENPHQQAALYKTAAAGGASLANAEQLHGKPLSFNNFNDAWGALALLAEFNEPCVVACKHAVPCGTGSAPTIGEAYKKAHESDPVAIFGGIVAANRPINGEAARAMGKIFLEVIIAPDYTPEALKILKKKKDLRLLKLALGGPMPALDMKNISGGVLVQQTDTTLLPPEPPQTVTRAAPTDEARIDMQFAWKVVKHVKSNGIVIVKNQQTIGIGTGQTSRIAAVRQAVEQARNNGAVSLEGAVMASDAFFPFPDCVEVAAQAGIAAIIQPGGSKNDQASIDACNNNGIAMIFTGIRHFRH